VNRPFVVPIATAALAVSFSLAAVAPAPARAGLEPRRGDARAGSVVKDEAVEAPPFARVYLALRGCTSCSHCRSTIRKMVKGSAEGGETRVDGGRVEVRYSTPRPVPLRDVVRTLAENRLHDLDLVDVLFEAKGTLQTQADGSARFTLWDTGQVFRLAIAPRVERPVDGRPVRVVAVVAGWREKGELSLEAREIKVGA
jgi:hypothetical protein